MALVQELEACLQAELTPEEYAAAQSREMDVGETAVSLWERRLLKFPAFNAAAATFYSGTPD